MPAAHKLSSLLDSAGMLPCTLSPVIRVRFHLLDQLDGIKTIIRPPDYLASQFNSETITASDLAASHRQIRENAISRLEMYTDAERREKWIMDQHPETVEQINVLKQRKMEVIRANSSDPAARDIWLKIRELHASLLKSHIEQVITDYHLSKLDFWDSRGAILPISVGLGGIEFYNKIISEARIYEEALV